MGYDAATSAKYSLRNDEEIETDVRDEAMWQALEWDSDDGYSTDRMMNRHLLIPTKHIEVDQATFGKLCKKYPTIKPIVERAEEYVVDLAVISTVQQGGALREPTQELETVADSKKDSDALDNLFE